MSADEMMKIVADGKGTDMDAYGREFSKDQIKALVEYYRSLAK
jgi:mono/diheme cytochrome c family protein